MAQTDRQRKAMFRKLAMKANALVNKKDFGVDGVGAIEIDRDIVDAKLERSFPESNSVDRTKAIIIAEQKKFSQ